MLLTSTLAINCWLGGLLKQGCLYHKLRKTFSKLYRRCYDLMSGFQVESLLHQGLSEPGLCGGLGKFVGSKKIQRSSLK